MNVNTRLILAILIGLGLLIVAIILVVRALSSLTGSDDPSMVPHAALVQQADNSSEMRFTEQGRINSDQEHRQVVITVSRSDVRIQVLQGFQGNVIHSAMFTNNEAAYAQFLRALDIAGFANGDDNPDLTDERGQCADGRRYILEASGEDGLDTRYWGTNCRSAKGTSRANIDDVLRLFRAQVPDYNRQVRGVHF